MFLKSKLKSRNCPETIFRKYEVRICLQTYIPLYRVPKYKKVSQFYSFKKWSDAFRWDILILSNNDTTCIVVAKGKSWKEKTWGSRKFICWYILNYLRRKTKKVFCMKSTIYTIEIEHSFYLPKPRSIHFLIFFLYNTRYNNRN